jgi:O-antigen ligase
MKTVSAAPQSDGTVSSAPSETIQTANRRWQSGLDVALELGVSWLIGLLLVSSVVFMGGRYDWGWLAWAEPAFAGIVTLATLLWLIRLALRPQLGVVFSWSLVLLAGGALIGCLQLVALPKWLLLFCSPGLPANLPLWFDDGSGPGTLGSWTCASLVPHRTADALRYFALYCLTFLLVIQNVRTLNSVRRFLQVISVLGIGTALFGIIQYLFWNDKFYWFFEIPWVPNANCCRGPFTTKNHFAGFLAMAIGPTCYWMLSALGPLNGRRAASPKGRGDYLIPIGCFALSCLMLASFLSVSRGGIIATTLAFAVAAVGLTCYVRSRRLWIFVAILTCITFGAFLTFAGPEQIAARLGSIGVEHEVAHGRLELDLRLSLWRGLIKTVPDSPILGTGYGTHQYVYQLYYGDDYEYCFTHAENSYLQLLTEGGIATAVLVVVSLCCLCYWCVTSLRSKTCSEARLCVIAVMASLIAAAFHGAVDFVWYIPSHAMLLAVLAGLACALARIQKGGNLISLPFAPRFWVGAAGVVCTLLLITWLSASYHHAQAVLLWTQFQSSPDGEYADQSQAARRTYDASLVSAALRERASFPRYHAKFAELSLQRFLHSNAWKACPMPLIQIGTASENSGFDTPQKRNRWLDSVYGSDNRELLESAWDHFDQAVRRYPLDAPSYLRLAELHFVAAVPLPSRCLLRPSRPNPIVRTSLTKRDAYLSTWKIPFAEWHTGVNAVRRQKSTNKPSLRN